MRNVRKTIHKTTLEEFGHSVRKARTKRGMTLEMLAYEALGNQERKSYVSAVERGKKKLSPLTIQKFAKALDLPDSLVDSLLLDDVTEDEPATQTERDADRLFDELTVLRDELKLSESLAIALAYEYAAGNPSDLQSALRELKRAFEVASRHTPGSNLDTDLSSIMTEVDRLNEEESLDAASRTLKHAMAARRDRIELEKAAMLSLLDKGIAQAVMERSARDASACEVEKIEIEVHDQNARFDALRSVRREWYERGRDKGLSFDLEVSIELAQVCLERATKPDETGIALNDLGTALQTLGARESRTERLEQAVTAYRAALKEWPRERAPLDWATTQNNLGNALATLGIRQNGTELLEQAVTAYRAALVEYTRERVPLDWATTQNNLGNALRNLGERESGTELLEQAVTAYRAALEEWTRERVPLDWATTQNNLGNALRNLGGRENGTERLELAVTAYRAALVEYTRERVPLDWAGTQNNLGNALSTLGKRENGTERLEQAVTAFRAALEEYTRERVPLDWAMTQNNLGNALQTLGERENGTERLEQAVTAYRAALEERTRETVPLDWAMTQFNLGIIEATFSKKTGDPAYLDQAEAHVRAAREVFAEGNATQYLGMADQQLDEINHLRNGPSA